MAKTARFFQLSQARNAGPAPTFPKELLEGQPMRLNKFLAHAGIGNRRVCENLIKAGQVKVNQELVKNPGHLVDLSAEIEYLGQIVTSRPGLAYALVNRTAGLEENRLGELIRHPDLPEIGWESVFPRADKIAGLSLLTNDEQLKKELQSKVGLRTTTIKVSREDGQPLVEDLVLDFGGEEEEIELKNRTIRLQADGSGLLQIPAMQLEFLGAAIDQLPEAPLRWDVIQLLAFSKRDLPRGFYRFLQAEEIRQLRHFS